MMKKIMFFLLLFLLLLSGCTGSKYENVNVDDAKQMIDNGEVEIIDVRTPEEFASGHIPGAKLMPLQLIDSMQDELKKDQKYLIVCRSGNRSTEASGILAGNGFKNIYNMTGGMNEWTYEIEQ